MDRIVFVENVCLCGFERGNFDERRTIYRNCSWNGKRWETVKEMKVSCGGDDAGGGWIESG